MSKLKLLDFLTLGIGRDTASVSAYRRPLGYQQLTLTPAAQQLTLPANVAGFVVGYCVIQCDGSATTDYARWRDDGTDPTATVGMQLFQGQELDYSGDLSKLSFIIGNGAPILNVSYYA